MLQRLKRHLEADLTLPMEREIGDAAMGMLKCSFGRTLIWLENGESRAVTVLKWGDKSVFSGVEGLHNPGSCLQAAGWTIGERVEVGTRTYCGSVASVTRWDVRQGNLDMYAYSTVFRRLVEPVEAASTAPVLPMYAERLRPVIKGRRDAPVYIILVYLPKSTDGGNESFDTIMRSILCTDGSQAETSAVVP